MVSLHKHGIGNGRRSNVARAGRRPKLRTIGSSPLRIKGTSLVLSGR